MVFHYPSEITPAAPVCQIILAGAPGHTLTMREDHINCEACRRFLAEPQPTFSLDELFEEEGRLCSKCHVEQVQPPKEVCASCRDARLKAYRHTDRYKSLARSAPYRLTSIKQKAARRNISFSLVIEDVQHLANTPCTYCGDPLSSLHLDRVDNTKGYEPGNVVQCCPKCNTWKGSDSVEQLLQHALKILARSKQPP